MQVLTKRSQIVDLRNHFAASLSLGLVPTMGALHEGHLTLARRSSEQNDHTLVSIFVNPTQFSPGEDLDHYPRTLTQDIELLKNIPNVTVFAPDASEMYAAPNCTNVHVSGLTQRLCGPLRPGHFEGVATICTKLLNLARADRAYFGLKDAQQYAVIQSLALDLNIPTEIIGVDTVRTPSGLALSSRNRYLSSEELVTAKALYVELKRAGQQISSIYNHKEPNQILKQTLTRAHTELTANGFQVQYFEALDWPSLQPLHQNSKEALIAVAGILGKTRLIDNIRVQIQDKIS